MGTTIFGSSWAMSAAAFVGLSAPPIGTYAISTAPMSPSFSSEEVADLAEVDRVDSVDLDDERDALAVLGALGVVAVRANAGDEDLLDLVLAGAVEDECRVEAGGDERGPVPGQLALGLAAATGASSGWLYVTMSPVIPRPVGPTTDW